MNSRCKPFKTSRVLTIVCLVSLSGWILSLRGQDPVVRPPTVEPPASAAEARARARLLHETVHGMLQVVHRDLFRADESTAIPSKSMEDVFAELAGSFQVELQWLAVDTKAMDVEHEADSPFEQDAVKALAAGKTEYEMLADHQYQFAGRIRLSAQCLSCHAPLRNSNDDHTAALLIRMPIQK